MERREGMGAVAKIVEDKIYDLSHCYIRGHAMARYIEKCKPGLSMIEVNQIMKEKLKSMRKVELQKNNKKHEKYKCRETYMDVDENIYIVEKDEVITVFPNERIFKAKTLYSNRKTGQKYL